MQIRSVRIVAAATALCWALAACLLASPQDRTPGPTAIPPQPTETATPTSTPMATPTREMTNLATLQARLTADPCGPAEVETYSERVLPLANDHLANARQAQPLEQISEPKVIDEMYDRARDRSDRLEEVVPPPCAETAHLKFSHAADLLVDVWDHIGEGEFDLARRKLISSQEELALGADLLSEVEAEVVDR